MSNLIVIGFNNEADAFEMSVVGGDLHGEIVRICPSSPTPSPS